MTEHTDTAEAPAIGAPVERDIVRVGGPDASTFLQGQVSQDVSRLHVATSAWSFVLHPQGKVHSWVRVTKSGADTFLLDVDGGFGEAVADRLRMFLIRTDAYIEAVEWPCVAVRGVDPPRGSLEPDVLRLPLARDPGEGYDLLGPGAAVPDGVDAADPSAVEARRIVDGVPAMGKELTDDTIPAEIGQWIIDASVSFNKGCFVGQELVARIDSRGGNVPRHLRGIVTDRLVKAGDPVTADGPAGPVTSVADDASIGPVALAYVSRKTDVGAEVTVAGVRGVVHELPLCVSSDS